MEHIKNGFKEMITIKWDAGNGDINKIGPQSDVDINFSSPKIIKVSKTSGDWPITCIKVDWTPISTENIAPDAVGCVDNVCITSTCPLDPEDITGKKEKRCRIDEAKDQSGVVIPNKWIITPNKDVDAFCLKISVPNGSTLISLKKTIPSLYSDPGATVTIGEP